jgi:hypothetical protein
VREERRNGKHELAFHARPFILCGIPLRRPPADLWSAKKVRSHASVSCRDPRESVSVMQAIQDRLGNDAVSPGNAI